MAGTDRMHLHAVGPDLRLPQLQPIGTLGLNPGAFPHNVRNLPRSPRTRNNLRSHTFDFPLSPRQRSFAVAETTASLVVVRDDSVKLVDL